MDTVMDKDIAADIEAGSVAGAASPQFAQIEPVGQCQLRCQMGPVQFRTDGHHGAPAFMALDIFRKLVGQMPQLRELHLQGLAEPLLHPRFFDMVRFAALRGVDVSTTTNMTLMSEARALECVRSGLRSMHVSIGAADGPADESIRKRAKYDKVLRNLRRVLAAKAALASELPHVHMVAVVMQSNLAQLPGLVRLAAAEGALSLSVQHLGRSSGEASLPLRCQPMRDFVDQQTLQHENAGRVAHVFAETRALADQLGLALRLPNPPPRAHRPGVAGRERCDWPWRGPYLRYDGQAMPCCIVGTPDHINFGNMARDGVDEVWNSDAYRAFRQQHFSLSPPDVCRSCAVYAGTF